MESRADDPKLAEASAAVLGEAETLIKPVERQVVMALPVSESFQATPARVVEQVTPVVVGQGTDKRKRVQKTKSSASKLHPAPKMMKEEEEEVCFICFDGGSLVLCDHKGCPKAYHPACIKREEAFFQSKVKWLCGWHICSVCQKASNYMCYTCTYSLCKKCTKDADYVCVRGNKGFCLMCMKTIMMIENKDAGNKELIQVDFDDKTSWEYLFKVYWNFLKGKLSLSLDELTQAKNPCVEVMKTDFKQQITVNDKSTVKPSVEKRKISDVCTDWGSKELLGFVAHMKNGDTSVLSQSDVQALLMEYIKRNNLRDPHIKSQIICDLRLKLLFGKPRVGHVEMLKLLEYHYLIKEDTPKNGDDYMDDSVSNRSKRQKTRKKGLEEYASVDVHNINLIFLRRSAMENLIDEEEKFHDKVVGSFVRIRVSCNDEKQDFYRLVRVVGTSKGPEPYKLGDKTTYIMLEVLNLDKKEPLSIDAASNQVFTEDECRRLHESIKCGIVKPLTVGEIQMKAVALQALRFDDWLIAEILRLSHLRDRANEKGRKKEHKECVEKLKLLRTPEVRHQKLTEIPDVHVDPKMNLNHQSEDDTSKNDKQKDEVSKLDINGVHTLPLRKCVKEEETTSAQGVQHKRDDGSGSNSSPNRRLRPRKIVKENKTTSAQRVQPRRGRIMSNSLTKPENNVSVGNQSALNPDSETATVGPVSTIRVQPKRDGVRSNSIPKQENDVFPGGGSSSVVVSTIRVQPKRGEGRSNIIPKQENHVSPGGSSVVGNQSVPMPDSETGTVGPVSTIRVQPKRDGDKSKSIPKQLNNISPGGSSNVLGNHSVTMPDSVTITVGPVSKTQKKKVKGRLKSSLMQKEHVSASGSSVGGGIQSVGPVSKTQVQENHVSPDNGSSTAIGNQSVLMPDSVTSTVGSVSGTSLSNSDTQMEKLWHYRDPSGKIQGPFSMVQLQKWSTTGYFPVDMKIWTDNEQEHSVLLTDALTGAHALDKEKEPEVVQWSDFLKNVPVSSDNNNLEQTCPDPLNQVTKHGVEKLSNAGANEAPLHDSPDIECKDGGVNEHPNEDPLHHQPSIESEDAPLHHSPIIESEDALLHHSPIIESEDAPLHHSPIIESEDALLHHSPIIESADAPLHHSPIIESADAPLHHSPIIESEDAPPLHHLPIIENEYAPLHHSPIVESEDACVNEHSNEDPLHHSPSLESVEKSYMNQKDTSCALIRPPVLLNLDLNNKDCNQTASRTNPSESSKNKGDLDLINLPCPNPKTINTNSENQFNEQDSISIDIQAAELLRSLSGYVPVSDLPIPTPKPSDDWDLRNPKQNPSDENHVVGESEDGPRSPPTVGGGSQLQETIASVWVSSPVRDEPSCKEWDFGLVPMSSDQVATTTPNGNRNLLLDLSSWPVGINEPIEFNTLAEESVSDLLAEVDAMESKSGLPSPSSAMRCGDDLIDRNDCFSSIEELSPTPDAGKSDAVSSDPEIHDHDPIGASQVSAFDPLKRLTAHSTTTSGGETMHRDIRPPAPPIALNKQPMVNAPNHVWGGVQGNPNLGWVGPPPLPLPSPPPLPLPSPPPLPPPQAYGNGGWQQPNIGTAMPWVDSNLSLGAYNGNGGWDSPHRFSGSRDYAVQGGDSGFGRGGRPLWSRQQHGGGGGGGHFRPSPKGQRVCKFYESGYCKKGAACGYLHP